MDELQEDDHYVPKTQEEKAGYFLMVGTAVLISIIFPLLYGC